MINIKIDNALVQKVSDIVCDSCGKSCRGRYDYEYMTIYNHWAYGSKKDGEYWEAHICESCVDDKLGFIKFNKMDYLYSGSDLSKSRQIVNNHDVIIK